MLGASDRVSITSTEIYFIFLLHIQKIVPHKHRAHLFKTDRCCEKRNYSPRPDPLFSTTCVAVINETASPGIVLDSEKNTYISIHTICSIFRLVHTHTQLRYD